MTKARMIFCLTTGRSGTAYLAEMLSLIPGVSAHHEPAPGFEMATRGALETGEQEHFWTGRKLEAVDALRGDKPIYIETSHGFKYLARGLLECGEIADLIMLHRPPTEVAYSYWCRQHIPGRTPVGLRYFAQPDDPYTVLPLYEWKDLTDYQLCYWYTLETECRNLHLASVYHRAGARVVSTTLADVATRDGFKSLIKSIALLEPDREEYDRVYNQHINALLTDQRRHLPDHYLEQEIAVTRRVLRTNVMRSIE